MDINMNVNLLLNRLKNGMSLSTSDIEAVRDALAQSGSNEDPYTLIHLLWKSRDLASERLLKNYLHWESHYADDDGMVRRIALQAVADLWPSEDTFSVVSERLQHDSSGHVRQAAASVMGDLGRSLPSVRKASARILLDRFNSLAPQGGLDWEASYEGLLNLIGVPFDDRPSAARQLRLDDVRRDIVDAAERIVNGDDE
jgi:hypothetical protein